jgi:hypothetical protein
MIADGRITSQNWDQYDTRHVVYRPAKIEPQRLEAGYWQAYKDFYNWLSIFKGAWTNDTLSGRLRHLVYAGGWKKCEPVWDLIIKMKRLPLFKPLLESVLGNHNGSSDTKIVGGLKAGSDSVEP